ncbi:MAG: zf-HC2 domain-containing protein [Acidobacteriota bacterium]|nr:zf-HC2 domain-containing protein [Acidobacteriota bacterium]
MKHITCRRVEPLLALAAGGDLSSSRAAAVEEHLRTCGDCRRAAEDLTATVHTIRELPALRVSPEETAALRRSVWNLIEKDRATGRLTAAGSRRIVRKTAGWAVAGLVAVALLLPWRPSTESLDTSGAAISAPPPRRGMPAATEPGPAPAATKGPAASETAPRIARRGAPRRARAIPEPSQPVRIELSTPDPDVRIVWLVGSPPEDLPPLTDDIPTTSTSINTKEDRQ